MENFETPNNETLSDYEKSLLKSEEEMVADACAKIDSQLTGVDGEDVMVLFPDVTESGQQGTPEALENTQRMADKVKAIYEAKGYTVRAERYVGTDFREFYFYFNEKN